MDTIDSTQVFEETEHPPILILPMYFQNDEE